MLIVIEHWIVHYKNPKKLIYFAFAYYQTSKKGYDNKTEFAYNIITIKVHEEMLANK
jgi:hypothetical protein